MSVLATGLVAWRGSHRACNAQGLATNFGELLAAVMIAAVGGSVHVTMSVSLVSDLLPPQHVR